MVDNPGSRLRFPADEIDYKSIAVGDVVTYTMRHYGSPGYDTFTVSIERPAEDKFVVQFERHVRTVSKRGGRPPDAGVTYISKTMQKTTEEVHEYLRKAVPYSSFCSELESRLRLPQPQLQ